MEPVGNLLEIAIAYYKDKVQQELLDKFRVESRLLLQADAEARRIVARENILAMARLQRELIKFKLIYSQLSVAFGNVEAIDSYIRRIEMKIKKISYQKNHIR